MVKRCIDGDFMERGLWFQLSWKERKEIIKRKIWKSILKMRELIGKKVVYHSYSLSTWVSILKVQPPYIKQHNKIRGEKSCQNIIIEKTHISNKYQNNINSTISSLSTVIMHNLFFHKSQQHIIFTLKTTKHKASSHICIWTLLSTYMNVVSHLLIIFPELCYWTFTYIICQRYVTRLSPT